MEGCGLSESSNPLACPVVRVHEDQVEKDDEEPLGDVEARKFRALAARLNCLSLDRSDVQYARKEVSAGMARPWRRDASSGMICWFWWDSARG